MSADGREGDGDRSFVEAARREKRAALEQKLTPLGERYAYYKGP